MTGCRSKLSLSSESNVKPLLYAAKSPHFWQWGAGSSISCSPLPENHPISMIWDFKQHLPLPLEVVKWLERGWKPVYQPHLWTAVTGRIQKVYYDAQKRLVLVEHSHAHAHTHTQNLPSLTLLYAEAQRGSSHPFAGYLSVGAKQDGATATLWDTTGSPWYGYQGERRVQWCDWWVLRRANYLKCVQNAV